MNLKARLRTAIAKRNALTVDQMAQLLGCPKQVVLNLVELGRLTPLSTNPLVFSQEEAQRGKKEYDRRQEALTEIIRLGETGLESFFALRRYKPVRCG